MNKHHFGAICALALASSPALAADDTVKIGVLGDMSGVYADGFSGKGAVAAVNMAVADFGGSVLGHKIEVISADHQNKPDIGSALAPQMGRRRPRHLDRRPHQLRRRPSPSKKPHPTNTSSASPPVAPPPTSPARPAPNTASITATTPTRCRSAPPPPSSRKAARAGISSPPTTPSATRSSRAPATPSKPSAAPSSARQPPRSPPPISRPTCSPPKPPAPRSSA